MNVSDVKTGLGSKHKVHNLQVVSVAVGCQTIIFDGTLSEKLIWVFKTIINHKVRLKLFFFKCGADLSVVY